MKLTSSRNVWPFTIRKCCKGSQNNDGNDQTTGGTKQHLMLSVPPVGPPLYSVEVTLLTTLSSFPQSHYSKDKDTDFVEKWILISVQFKALNFLKNTAVFFTSLPLFFLLPLPVLIPLANGYVLQPTIAANYGTNFPKTTTNDRWKQDRSH